MEDIFNTPANIAKPCNIPVAGGSSLDKSLLFKRLIANKVMGG